MWDQRKVVYFKSGNEMMIKRMIMMILDLWVSGYGLQFRRRGIKEKLHISKVVMKGFYKRDDNDDVRLVGKWVWVAN